MFIINTLSLLLTVATSGFAIPTPSANNVDFTSSSVVERLNGPPSGWSEDKSITFNKDTAIVKLRINLVREGVQEFQDLAINIATPGHELYGKHLSQNVISAMIAPKDESKDLVMTWLASEGLADHAAINPGTDSIIVQASLSQIEKLLDAEYSVFVQESSGQTVIRTLEYSLPKSLTSKIKMVQPTTFFGLRALRSEISGIHPLVTEESNGIEAVTGCTGTTITPTCLAHLYNFASASQTQTAGLLGIAGFLEQHPSLSDLSTFLKDEAVFANTAETYTCTLVNGGTCPTTTDPGIEANLDVQYARAITAKIPNIFYSVGGSPPIVTGSEPSGNTNEPYLQFLDFLIALSDADLPNTVTISYGDDEDTVPLSYADEVCTLFSTLGARGVSILVASGDAGVGTTCLSGAGGTKGFDTSFPASCPFVTVVGGTTGNSPEAAWTDGGGGFSNVFGQPSYQKAAVNAWVTKTGDSSGFSSFFNTSGRAYPDVAAQATNFVIIADGAKEGVDGTSCATPTFASVIQLINSARVAAGSPGLGFLNPFLYGTVAGTAGLTDIVTGKNTGCSGVISGAGFEAVTGWDPATGLGTPNYEELLSLAGT